MFDKQGDSPRVDNAKKMQRDEKAGGVFSPACTKGYSLKRLT